MGSEKEMEIESGRLSERDRERVLPALETAPPDWMSSTGTELAVPLVRAQFGAHQHHGALRAKVGPGEREAACPSSTWAGGQRVRTGTHTRVVRD